LEALLLLVVVLILGLPITAIVLAGVAKAAVSRADARLGSLEKQLSELRWRNGQLEQRLTWLLARLAAERPESPAERPNASAQTREAAAGPSRAEPAVTAPDAAPKAVPAATPEPTGPRPAAVATLEPTTHAAPVPVPAATAEAAAPGRTEPPINQPPPGVDWERLVGVRGFAWVGGGALFLAAALFLHYSIQKNLISPEVRVAIGIVVGALCLAGGDQLRRRTPVAGFALSGAGVAILYASLFAARVLYRLIGPTPTFFAMCLVTVTAGVLSVRRNAYFVALLGLVGGMATPFLLASGEDRPLALFVYVALLSAGVLVVARAGRWASLGLLGALLATAVFAGWASRYLVSSRAAYVLAALTVVGAMFALTRVPSPEQPERARDATDASRASVAQSLVAVLVLFVVPLVMLHAESLEVGPLLLSVYLIVVSALSFMVARHRKFEGLVIGAAFGTVLGLVVRVDTDLFPEHRLLALACSSLPPVVYFGWWLFRRSRAAAHAEYTSALIVLSGALIVAFKILAAEPRGAGWTLLLGYTGLHAALLVAMGAISSRGLPVALGQTLLLLSLIPASVMAPHPYDPTVAALGVTLGFFLLPAAHPRLRSGRLSFTLSAVALGYGFLFAYLAGRNHYGRDAMGVLAIISAALCVAMLGYVRRQRALPGDTTQSLSALFGAEALAFLTAAVPILLQNEWLTMSWALEVAALAWLHRRIPRRGLVVFAALLAAAVTIRLLLNPALFHYHPRTATPILNHYLYTIGVPALAFLAAAHWFILDEELAEWRLRGLLRIAATLFLFLLLNVEIADVYSTGSTLSYRWSGESLAEDMSYSLAWGSFALVLLLTGIFLRQRPVRIGALLVLVLTIGKVFLHDLWTLGALYRVGSIVGLAVALLGVSFLTQRFILREEK
jgi:uncharacterized membrane protein